MLGFSGTLVVNVDFLIVPVYTIDTSMD